MFNADALIARVAELQFADDSNRLERAPQITGHEDLVSMALTGLLSVDEAASVLRHRYLDAVSMDHDETASHAA